LTHYERLINNYDGVVHIFTRNEIDKSLVRYRHFKEHGIGKNKVYDQKFHRILTVDEGLD